MEEAGLTSDDLRRAIDNPDFRRQLVEFWQAGQRFGPTDWETYYGLTPTVPDFPWNEDVLNGPCKFVKGKRVRDTHFAFLGVSEVGGDPLTIMKLHELHPPKLQPHLYFSSTEARYNKQEFATQRTCQARWYLMLAEAVPGSTNKSYPDQEAMLPPEYEVPLGVEETTKNLLYYHKFGRYPNTTVWARCQDVDSGFRVDVDSLCGSVCVYYWNDCPDSGIAVAASRKPGA